MGPVNLAGNENRKAGVRRMVKHNLKIDMTPMVDLGFLLISFFVITTQLSEPRAMDLYIPKAGPPTPVGESNAVTVLLGGNNTIYYYYGDWGKAVATSAIFSSNFSGSNSLRKVIIEKQLQLDANPNNKEGRNGLLLIIKPGNEASYKNLVDVLDEVIIATAKRYAVVKLSGEEAAWLKERRQ